MSFRRSRTLLGAAVVGLGLLASTISASAEPFALIASAKGKVEVVPAGGGDPLRASFGRPLERGDKVVVGPDATATIYFSDGNVIELGEKSSVTVGGKVGAAAKVGPGAELPGTVYASVSRSVTGGSRQTGLIAGSQLRGGPEQKPLLLAPRKCDVTTDRPAFTWRAVEGAARYKVTLSGEEGERWSRETTAPGLAYPADAAPLARDGDYLWKVEAFSDRGRLRDEETVFHVLSDDVSRTVSTDLSRIRESAGGADHSATYFLAGSYLVGRGLYSEAVPHFEALSRLAPDSPAPHEALGNIYDAVGLSDLAATEYQKALELTKSQP
jgi:hypothetical protein